MYREMDMGFWLEKADAERPTRWTDALSPVPGSEPRGREILRGMRALRLVLACPAVRGRRDQPWEEVLPLVWGPRCRGRVPDRPLSPATYTPKHLAEKILTSKAALEGERKQVTVLFADLKGSMELLADRDPEEARKLLDPSSRTDDGGRPPVRGHRQPGDGRRDHGPLRRPTAHEDHAVRACYAALRMQESVKHYAEVRPSGTQASPSASAWA